MWPLCWWCNVGTFHKRKRPVLVRDWLLQRQGSGYKKRTRCVSKPRWISFDVSWLRQKLTQGQTFNPSSLIGAIVSDGVTGGSGLGKHAVWETECPVRWQLKGCLQGQGQSSGGQYRRNVRSINISGGSLWMTSSFWTKSTSDFSASSPVSSTGLGGDTVRVGVFIQINTGKRLAPEPIIRHKFKNKST